MLIQSLHIDYSGWSVCTCKSDKSKIGLFTSALDVVLLVCKDFNDVQRSKGEFANNLCELPIAFVQ